MEPAPGAETCDVLRVGTVVFPPHAEVAKSAPAISTSTRLLKVGILNLTPDAVMTKSGSKCFFRRLQERVGLMARPALASSLIWGKTKLDKVVGIRPIKKPEPKGSFDPPGGAVSVEKITCDRFYLEGSNVMNTTGLVKYAGALVALAICSACAGAFG